MRVELKNAQGASTLFARLLNAQHLVLLNDELLIVMHPERIFLASETGTCILQRIAFFRITTTLILPLESLSQVKPYRPPSAPAEKSCGKR
jgi:hypothetical protein